MGAALGGGISLIRNFVYVCKGEKTAEEAAFCIAGDTTSAAAGSYITAFSGAIVKGSMQNSKNTLMRGISKTNLPAYIAVSTIEVGKTINRFSTGKIDEYQLVEELGEKGYGMVNSALFAAMGQAVIPIPIVGALAGSMLGYALSSASYHVLLDSLKTAKLAREERTKIECECAEAVAMLREYRSDLEKNINKYLLDKQDFFNTTFDMIKTSLNIGDIDGYICATNRITEEMGKKPLYSNMEEFDALMSSETTIKI